MNIKKTIEDVIMPYICPAFEALVSSIEYVNCPNKKAIPMATPFRKIIMKIYLNDWSEKIELD